MAASLPQNGPARLEAWPDRTYSEDYSEFRNTPIWFCCVTLRLR
jgi:hypothetical protein